MRRPAGNDLGKAGPLVVRLFLAVEEGLFREIITTTEASLRIDLRQLRVGNSGEERQDQSRDDSGPHVVRHRRAARSRSRGL